MKRVLFLDFDGVLNSTRWFFAEHRRLERAKKLGQPGGCWQRTWEFDPRNVRHLNAILTAVPDLHVVISSSWRKGMTVADLRLLLASVGVPAVRVIDKTSDDPSRLRHLEIRAWINANVPQPGILRFAALDDDRFDMEPLGADFFHVDRRVGLTRDQARAVVRHLRA